MIYYFIGGTNRTGDVEQGTLSKSDELQQRSDTARFRIISGARPTQNQEVLIYDGITIESQSGANIVLSQQSYFNKFREGDTLVLDVGGSEEEVTVSAVNGTALTLSASPSGSFSSGDIIAKKVFGGTVQEVSDENRHIAANLLLTVTCTDYTKIFDRKLVNDSWKDRTSKYIIVDFINKSVNYNQELESFEYANNTAIQAAWTESGDGDNPTIDTTNFQEGDTAGVFPWTNSGGTATFAAAPTAASVSDLVGVSSGQPTKGVLAFWYKQDDYTKASAIEFQIGSGASDYASVSLNLANDNNWHYARIELSGSTVTGTPDWQNLDYVKMVITETADSNIIIDGLRINATGSFTFDNVSTGANFEDFRSPFKKPTELIQRLADQNEYFWYIDYDRDIHFFSTETNSAPFNLDSDSDNYFDLKIATDATKIVNRQTVRGAYETTSTKTQQDFPGDGVRREWVLRNKFKNLSVLTAINTTAFSTASVGIDFIDDETSADYFSNFNAQSVRAASTTSTLNTASSIRFRYHEIVPIVTQSKDNSSITALKNILGNDGIFDGRVIHDNNLKSRNEADARAEIEIAKFSNPVIRATFTTNEEGLRSGQIIRIKDTTSGRNIDQNFVIQRVVMTPSSEYSGVNKYSVVCASTVFGIVELIQKLLTGITNLKSDENEVIYNVESIYEEVICTESWNVEEANIQAETVSCTESWTASVVTPPFEYGPGGSPQGYWNLSSWS